MLTLRVSSVQFPQLYRGTRFVGGDGHTKSAFACFEQYVSVCKRLLLRYVSFECLTFNVDSVVALLVLLCLVCIRLACVLVGLLAYLLTRVIVRFACVLGCGRERFGK